jgi:hypothetical protein
MTKLHIPSILGFFFLGFLSCMVTIALSRYIYVPLVVEIDTFFTVPTNSSPTFEHASVLELTPGESLLSILSTPLVKEMTTQGLSVQELVSSKWLGKKEIKEGAVETINIIKPAQDTRILGYSLTKIGVSFIKYDPLDLTILEITATLDQPREDVLEILTRQFGPPTKNANAEGRAEWHAEDGLVLAYSSPELYLFKKIRKPNTKAPNSLDAKPMLLQ